jgi:hypothetical protein
LGSLLISAENDLTESLYPCDGTKVIIIMLS